MTGKMKTDAIDTLETRLRHIGTLGDLLQSYRPEHAGETKFGDTASLAGAWIFEEACDAQAALEEIEGDMGIPPAPKLVGGAS